eukprot:2209026-Rhodomonas_salina.1
MEETFNVFLSRWRATTLALIILACVDGQFRVLHRASHRQADAASARGEAALGLGRRDEHDRA